MVFPGYQNDTIYSDLKGKFKIRISSHFRGNIHLVHPDYYQYLHNIKYRSNLYLQRIELITDTLALDTIFYPTYKGIRCIEGRVFDLQTRIPVEKAKIKLDDKKIIGYTGKNGFYKLCIPKTIDTLIVRHNDYYPYIFTIPKIMNKMPQDVLLEPLLPGVKKDTCFGQKNSMRLIISSLFTGAVAIDYERFLRLKHSVGLKSYLHLYKGIPYVDLILLSYSEMATFKGIKLSPYYRYYIWRNIRTGGFFEGKISWGYFDFEKIQYVEDPHHDDEDAKFFSETSNSLGFGGSFGWMIHSPRSPVVINFSFGFQYFPLNVPKTKQVKMDNWYTIKYNVDDLFWYMAGPGSYIEIKFMIGGIF